jgi:hypothetical protein
MQIIGSFSLLSNYISNPRFSASVRAGKRKIPQLCQYTTKVSQNVPGILRHRRSCAPRVRIAWAELCRSFLGASTAGVERHSSEEECNK